MSANNRDSDAPPRSAALFPYRYEAAVNRLGVLVGIADVNARVRGLEQLLLDVMHRERVSTTHKASGDSLEVVFEMFGETYRLVCVWESQRLSAARLWDVVAPEIAGSRSIATLAVMSDLEAGARVDGGIVITRDAILDVFEGRDTLRAIMEARRGAIGSGERALHPPSVRAGTGTSGRYRF